MAVVRRQILVLIQLFIVFSADGQTNQSLTDTGSSSGCICDLVVNGCDPNCCCDADCSATDKEAFIECAESKNVISDDRICVSDQMIFIKNVPFATKNTGDGLFCIYHNNNKDQEQYSDVNVVTNNEDFIQSVNARNFYSYEKDNTDGDSVVNEHYKVGDKIILVLANQVKGYLALPTTFESSSCNDNNAAGYFQDDLTECVRSFSKLSSQCSEMTTLSAASYYRNFQVAMTPKAITLPDLNTTSNSSAIREIYNTSLFFTPELSSLLCREDTGVLNQCGFTVPPVPLYNVTTKSCENVVTEVSYTFTYSNESSNLERLKVAFVLANIRENFVQKFSIKFLKEGKQETFRKSGNPGYLVDQPVMAGLLQTQSATDKKAIILSTNSKEWLTLPKASLDGSCSYGVNDRLSVTFNMNVRSGCLIRLNQSSDCSYLQDIVYQALLGINPPDYVATFGNSDVKIVADWVKIINKPTNSPSGGDGVCSGMVLGMHIEILFANVGYLANPQAKIVGVRFKYEPAQTITYQCTGQFCSGGGSSSNSIEVVSSASFIDVSKPPISDQKSLPEFQSKAPSDFFHPFL
ncbi:tectonic-3-like [Dendronephthya gigantea]|uniref:tectonic-3-like n=1 Tax=Dendronephthya gigantea TaxID=151771 RepID=UPI00106D5FEB|nr:tectonic-3-like [Dendronephthya gigantea]